MSLHIKKFPGSIPGLNVLLVSVQVSLGYFNFLPHPKDISIRLAGYYKLPTGVNDCL